MYDATNDPKSKAELVAEIGKLGLMSNKLSFERGSASDKFDYQTCLAESRRVANALSDRVDSMIKEGTHNEADIDKVVNAMQTLASFQNRWSNLVDMQKETREINAHMAREAGFTPSGDSTAKLLAPNEKFAQGFDKQPNQPSLGQIMSSMVGANRDPDVKAALSEGIGQDGGFACPSYLSDEVIDAVRSKSVLVEAGARTVRLEGKEDSWLRIASDPSVNWHAENAEIPESQPTFNLMTFQPKTLTCLVKISRECFDDAKNVDSAIQLAISGAIAQELDRSVLFGGDANGPNGIFNENGVVEVPVNGALTDYTMLLNALYKLKKNNLWGAPTSWLLSTLAWYQLQGLTSSEKQPLMAPAAVAEVPQQVSTVIPDDMALVGDFEKCLLGFRSDLRIEFLNQAFSSRYQYGFLASVRLDAQLMHPGFFAKLTGIAEASTAKAK